MKQRMGKKLLTLVGLAMFSSLYATNGYFSHGYATKYKGLAGAGVALSLNTLGAAHNPAGMAFVGSRYDFSLALFKPNREYTVFGSPSGFPGTFGLAPGTVVSESQWFVIPALGANWMLNANSSFGVSLFGNGGMNTNYVAPTFGFSPTGVDLSQLFAAPAYARKFGSKHAIGVIAILAYQRFQAEGVSSFGNFSSDPANLSNNDYDNSFGFGGKIGWQGEWLQNLFAGAFYQSRTKMSELESYAGLFAEHGCFDILSNWSS